MARLLELLRASLASVEAVAAIEVVRQERLDAALRLATFDERGAPRAGTAAGLIDLTA